MKRHFLLRILLCICLLVCLIGCAEDVPEDPSVPVSSTDATQSTNASNSQDLPDANTLYEEAVQAIPADLSMTVSVTRQVSIADALYTSSTTQKITYLGLGTDTFAAQVTETAQYGDYSVDFSELYIDGTVYATICDEDFSSALSQEEFTARYLPPMLLDASLYGTVTADGDTISFSEPTALESWLLDEPADILQAEGSVTLTGGVLTNATYHVTYALGGAEITVSVTQSIAAPDSTKLRAPSDPDAYLPIESIDAPKLLDQAYGYLLQSSILDGRMSSSIFSQAAGYLLNSQILISAYDTGDSPMYQFDQSYYEMDYTRNVSNELDQVEVFRDGKYTMSVDGGRAQPNASVTLQVIQTYYQNILTECVIDTSYIKTAELFDLNGYYFVQFTCTDEFGSTMCRDICGRIFQDEELLNSHASAYRNNTLECYLAVDKYTGLPTSMGLTYEGEHTIDGYGYILSEQADYSFDLAGLEAYETITEDPLPETEPEEKATPLFYHVTGPDGQEMWLLGTIHVGDVRTGFLPQEIYDAFSASDALAIECNNTAFEEQVEQDDALSDAVADLYFYSDGTTVKDHVDAALYEDALKLMKATGNYNMNTEYMKPVLWYQALGDSLLSGGHVLTRNKGVESRLERLAEDQNKPIWEIESNMLQIEMLTGYSAELQELMLSETVSSSARENWEGVQALYELWCAGDEDALIEALRDDTSEMTEEELALYNEYNDAISVDRNVGMLEVAKQYLESGDTVFYAVGLAHLLAENGLVFTLRDAGYTVELVTYN